MAKGEAISENTQCVRIRNVNFCMISAEYQRQRANEFDKVKDVVGNFGG